jgi:hypothetical protein
MRYAIYFCPAVDTALGRLGRDWLATHTIELPGMSAERRDALLADVRRYGWHATIRAPFSLAENVTYDDLHQAVAALAKTLTPFALPLQINRLADFLALRPSGDCAKLHALAATCVEALMPLCAPLSDEALQRRSAGLDVDELALLQRYGYPYVLDRYRFHLTLSAPAAAHEEHAMCKWLEPRVAELPLTQIDALSICREAKPGAPFELLERIPLNAQRKEQLS